MRILHVIPQFQYFGGRTIVGGHASCLMTLALAQHEAGEEVTILSNTKGRSGDYEIEDGPRVHSLSLRAATLTIRYGLLFSREAVKWIRARAGEYDVIHFHSGYADYFLVSARLKRIARIPTLHTMYCPIPGQGGRWRLPLVHGLIHRWANQLDWRGAISENVASSLLKYGMRDVEQIPPPVDTVRLNGWEEADALRNRLGIGKEEEAILFVGNARKQKNLSGVLRALHLVRKDFPKVKLVVTTELKHSSSDKDMTRLSQEMEELNLGSCIIQQGIVNNMPMLMQACDILVAPFLDTLGPSDYFMAALEAMAAGRPVVVSNVGGMPEVVTEEVGQLVDPLDAESIASGLKTYLGDAALRECVGMNARRFIEQHFDPREIVAAYDKVYRRIAS